MPVTATLLAEYKRNGSEQAFRELVSAYLGLVYSTALRSLSGDSHLAEDVAQTVFIDLAHQAVFLPAGVRLGGWLHRHTCFVARKALRKEHRRRARETQAMQLQTIADYTQENISQLAGVLDDAINRLGEKEREAVILRFFEQQDFRHLANTLGSSQDAARMRVARALEKLKTLLSRRGFALSVSGLAYVLETKSAEAPPVAVVTRISQAVIARLRHGAGWLTMVKHALVPGLKVGVAGSVIALCLLFLLLPRGKTSAGPLRPGPTMTPMAFAGLDAKEDAPPAPAAPEPSPQAIPPPAVVAIQPIPAPPATGPAPPAVEMPDSGPSARVPDQLLAPPAKSAQRPNAASAKAPVLPNMSPRLILVQRRLPSTPAPAANPAPAKIQGPLARTVGPSVGLLPRGPNMMPICPPLGPVFPANLSPSRPNPTPRRQ